MGRQVSVIQLEGSVGNLSFYKTKDGYLVRQKSVSSGKRIKSAPEFARTRENMAEFTRAGRASKLLRSTFWSIIGRAGDGRLSNRLTSKFMKALQADLLHPRGQRNVTNGEPQLLEGFEFNQNTSLTKTFREQFSASIDRATGRFAIDIPAFSPRSVIAFPDGSTHFRLFSAGAAIDFEQNTFDVARSESEYLPISKDESEPLQLVQSIAPECVGPLFLLLGIEFFQSVNWQMIPMSNGFNALAVVKVERNER